MHQDQLFLLVGARNAGLEQAFSPVPHRDNAISDGTVLVVFDPLGAVTYGGAIQVEHPEVTGCGWSVRDAWDEMLRHLAQRAHLDDFLDRIERRIDYLASR